MKVTRNVLQGWGGGLLLGLLLWPTGVMAGKPARPAAVAQADAVAHTLRQIPEACIRLQGMFTGDAGQPYRLQAVPSSAQCQRRARFAGLSPQPPAPQEGWRVDERISVPSADCAGLAMTLTVWRRDGQAATPARDGQGRARIYLQQAQAQAQAEAGQLASLPQWWGSWQVQGRCG